MKSDLIIFGRSPFLNTLDIPFLASKYKTIGFNQFGRLFEPDFLFFFDEWYGGFIGNPLVFCPKWFKETEDRVIKYVPKKADSPLLEWVNENGQPCFSHKYFTVSIALNWAILQGFKRIYLVGIDHIETDTKFEHNDGTGCQSRLTLKAHQELKQYVYRCAEHAEIYQTNPAVRDDWELPFIDIEELY